MTVTDSVSTNKTVIGTKKVSGLCLRGCVMNVITDTTSKIYNEAVIALMRGFFVIYILYIFYFIGI